MQGLMQDYPLTLPHLFSRAERLFFDKVVVTVTAAGGSVTLPLFVEDSMVDGVVWIPGNRGGAGLGELRVTAGASVTVTGGAA